MTVLPLQKKKMSQTIHLAHGGREISAKRFLCVCVCVGATSRTFLRSGFFFSSHFWGLNSKVWENQVIIIIIIIPP